MDISLFTRKPVNVAAVQLTRDNCFEVAQWLHENEVEVHVDRKKERIVMYVPDSNTVRFGSWVTRLNGRFQGCSDEHFRNNYTEFERTDHGSN